MFSIQKRACSIFDVDTVCTKSTLFLIRWRKNITEWGKMPIVQDGVRCEDAPRIWLGEGLIRSLSGIGRSSQLLGKFHPQRHKLASLRGFKLIFTGNPGLEH